MPVYANPVLARLGLCNLLFPWARAEVFCRRTGAAMLAPKWTIWLRLGPWLRAERDKRHYMNLFKKEGFIGGIRKRLILWAYPRTDDPSGIPSGQSGVIDFRLDLETMNGYFDSFLEYAEYVHNRLWAITSDSVKTEIDRFSVESFIAVHVRRGDFSLLDRCIPDEWYVSALRLALSEYGSTFEGRSVVRVFSDERPEALQFLKEACEDVELMPQGSALGDLWLLSRARFLVATSRSTFSMWAVFLGQMPSVWHPVERPPRLYADPQVQPIVSDFGV